jgi:hypothetical protein
MNWRILLRPICWVFKHPTEMVQGHRLAMEGGTYFTLAHLRCKRCDHVLHL